MQGQRRGIGEAEAGRSLKVSTVTTSLFTHAETTFTTCARRVHSSGCQLLRQRQRVHHGAVVVVRCCCRCCAVLTPSTKQKELTLQPQRVMAASVGKAKCIFIQRRRVDAGHAW